LCSDQSEEKQNYGDDQYRLRRINQLRAAGLRVIQARAARGIAVGEFFPQGQLIESDYSKNQDSKNDANGVPFPRYQTAGVSFDATWELDFWGKFRRNIDAADLFPSISVGGSLGYEASDANDRSLENNLFDNNSSSWSFGPTLSWPILNYGRISSRT
jgi:outer membrane protein TolC